MCKNYQEIQREVVREWDEATQIWDEMLEKLKEIALKYGGEVEEEGEPAEVRALKDDKTVGIAYEDETGYFVYDAVANEYVFEQKK